MNPLHLLWICPLSAVFGIFLTAVVISSDDAKEIIEAKKADENPEFYPTSVDINYYLEGQRPSGLWEE